MGTNECVVGFSEAVLTATHLNLPSEVSCQGTRNVREMPVPAPLVLLIILIASLVAAYPVGELPHFSSFIHPRFYSSDVFNWVTQEYCVHAGGTSVFQATSSGGWLLTRSSSPEAAGYTATS
jgi:hypothetical protein